MNLVQRSDIVHRIASHSLKPPLKKIEEEEEEKRKQKAIFLVTNREIGTRISISFLFHSFFLSFSSVLVSMLFELFSLIMSE